MELSDYLPVLIQIVLAVGIGAGILVASHLFGQRAQRSKIKDSPYECGLATEKPGKTRYSVKFYVTAMLFILFDVDVVFLQKRDMLRLEILADYGDQTHRREVTGSNGKICARASKGVFSRALGCLHRVVRNRAYNQ